MQARITVIKKAFHQDIIEQYFPKLVGRTTVCSVFQEGQTFVVDAWTDLHD